MALATWKTVSCVSSDVLRANMASCLARGLPPLAPEPEKHGPIAIVGTGPSLRDCLDDLMTWPGPIWACNGALNWLADRGVLASAFLGVDAKRMPMLGYVDRRYPVRYYLGSTVHPDVFDAVAGLPVSVWHVVHDEEVSPPSGSVVIPGGPTVLTRAPLLAHMMGWRDIHLFGCDGSFDKGIHVYDSGLPEDTIRVRIGDREFLTRGDYMQSAAWLSWAIDRFAEQFGGTLTLHGDGLAQTLASAPIHDAEALLGEAKPDHEYLVAKGISDGEHAQI